MLATGAGAEMRQSLGTAVFSGMLGVTGFGLVFTPLFYVLIRGLVVRRATATTPPTAGTATMLTAELATMSPAATPRSGSGSPGGR